LQPAGAIGTMNIANPASMDIPWSRISVNRNHPSMDLADAEFNETPGQQLGVAFNPASAEQLFAGSGHTFAELAALGKDRKPLPHFPLSVLLKANAVILTKSLESSNIVAKLPGSDPSLKNEFVVLSAHIDHIGIGAPINGDRIYNGAMDDGSGSALVMDIAASLKAHPEKIRRSILFLLVTAEEKGLLGSKYFAAHPTVAAKSIVADVNVEHVSPHRPAENTQSRWPGGIRSGQPGRSHRAVHGHQTDRRSRATSQHVHSQAISTTSSGTAFRRSSATSASSLVHPSKKSSRIGSPIVTTRRATT